MMDMKRFLFFIITLCVFLHVYAQNITDLEVLKAPSLEGHVLQSEQSTVADSIFLHPTRVKFDNRCFQIEGKDVFLLSGTFHYFRTPQSLWKDRLKKLKDAGFNCVETYVPWNWHERQMPLSIDDVSKLDMKPLEDFLILAEELGLYVIVRPGPYICAEWSGGGFPQWLMQKKPLYAQGKSWLQGNDSIYLHWTEHWYKAVCRVVAPHQVFRRKPNTGGVLLFQIENEYNRVRWFSKSVKRESLEQLATVARNNGIEVPMISCWTSEARNVENGPLSGVVDMVNSYPRWQIQKGFGRLIDQQLKSQPGKPLLSGELQGGWYSGVDGCLSNQQDGVAAVQTQNILLYALQRGFCGVNFYMAVGGTNFDDWAARDITTTYDFAAAISEDGALTDRYFRLQAISPVLLQHATKIARAKEIYPSYECTDSMVQVALRQTSEGDRYYFVRTEEHSTSHQGKIWVDGLSFSFRLEPFGSQIYYVKVGSSEGSWLPLPNDDGMMATSFDGKQKGHIKEPSFPKLTVVKSGLDMVPRSWNRLPVGKSLDDMGIWGRHLVFYRTLVTAGSLLRIGRTGKNVVNGSSADGIVVSADGVILKEDQADKDYVAYRIPGRGGKVEVLILYDPKGLHHHTNLSVEQHWKVGLTDVTEDGKPVAMEYAYIEKSIGQRLSQGKRANFCKKSKSNLLKWQIYKCAPITSKQKVHLHVENQGDGFIYVNGECLGRLWQQGPQTDYYIPSCFLNDSKDNYIAISLYSDKENVELSSIEFK